MLRRVMVAVIAAGGVAFVALPAGADYPPVPLKVTTTLAPKPLVPTTLVKKVVRKPEVVVVVREVPVAPRRPLARTGTSNAVPLTALATASVGVGLTLVCLTGPWPGRRRRRHHRLV